jgi:hypothetical protein
MFSGSGIDMILNNEVVLDGLTFTYIKLEEPIYKYF